MSRLELILIAITTLSILFNIFIIAYARKAIVELLSISEEHMAILDLEAQIHELEDFRFLHILKKMMRLKKFKV